MNSSAGCVEFYSSSIVGHVSVCVLVLWTFCCNMGSVSAYFMYLIIQLVTFNGCLLFIYS
jgi:hypothetical protein